MGASLVKAPQQSKFNLGDEVTWTYDDADIPEGMEGKIVSFTGSDDEGDDEGEEIEKQGRAVMNRQGELRVEFEVEPDGGDDPNNFKTYNIKASQLRSVPLKPLNSARSNKSTDAGETGGLKRLSKEEEKKKRDDAWKLGTLTPNSYITGKAHSWVGLSKQENGNAHDMDLSRLQRDAWLESEALLEWKSMGEPEIMKHQANLFHYDPEADQHGKKQRRIPVGVRPRFQ